MIRRSFLNVFIGLLAIVFFNSCQSYRYRIADNYYEQYAYSKAIPRYEQVLRKDFIPDAATKLADSYRKNGNSLKAEIWLKRLVKLPDVPPQQKLDLAEVLMENGKYSEAKTWFQEYLALNSSDLRVKKRIIACDSISQFFEDTTVYEISYLKFNKDLESNFSPAFYHQGLVFLSDRSAPGKNKEKSVWTGKEYLDLFYTRKMDSLNWIEPEILRGSINGLYDEGPAVFSSDNNTIYFTRNDYSGKVIEKNQKDINVLKLYYGKLEGNKWVMGGQMPFSNNDYSVGHPALSADGNTIYFVSDMPWGYGGTDIYKVTLKDGKWTEPVNLGPKINSEGNEMFPFISADSVMYYASDGQVGLGGLDIYSSSWDGESWSVPENLHYPINSSKDDFGFIIDQSNSYGYFSSNRNRNIDKIYGFKKNLPVFNLKLTIKEKKSIKPIRNISITYYSKESNKKTVSPDPIGNLQLPLNINSNYRFDVKAFGYYANEFLISTVGKRKSQSFVDTLAMDKIELNKPVIWKSLDFKGKSTEITPAISKGLDSLYTILVKNPEMQIEIDSHTDSRGSAIDNMNISKNRSDQMALYLINKGIAAPRIVSIGYGESKLLNFCRDGILCLEEDHRVNNRVEIKIVELLK